MLRYIPRSADGVRFERPAGMPEALHRLLMGRGIDSAEAAERFLNPDERSLHDPMRLSGMAAAVARLERALEAGETICVYGDYDVDGVCASAILSGYLRARGGDARAYLPSRHSEGYGLNEAAVRAIAGWASLMVTVDCGVTSVALVALAKSLGLDMIVTDHHQPGEVLPDCPVVNPLLADYPFPALCGAGVAWKIVWAMGGREAAMAVVDIAALATVADVVSLTGENRAIVRMGLEAINRAPRVGIAALIAAAGMTGKPITANSIAFQLAPRLNAGGRLGSAERSLKLVESTDGAEAQALAAELEEENALRKQVEQDILSQAQKQLEGFDFTAHRALILAGKDWNPGVIGLAASRLVEQYHYPVVMLADQGDRMTGSCRSIEGVDIHAALTGCADTLVKFGGHRQAAGLTLLPERLEDFRRAMDDWLLANVDPNAYIPREAYDTEIDFTEVTPGLIAALEAMQPTGFGNPAPLFRARAAVVEARAVGAEGAHLKLILSQGGRRIGGIAFRKGFRAAELSERVDALFVPKLNTFMGRTEAQLEVKVLKDDGPEERLRAKLPAEGRLQCEFLTQIFYNRKILPEAKVPAVEAETLTEWLRREPQGTLILTSEFEAARRLCREAGECAPDVRFGDWPPDPRAFNAVCVCPRSGAVPTGYRRVVLWGIPRGFPLEAGGAEVLCVEGAPGWIARLPDLDALRTAYRGLMALAGAAPRCGDAAELASELARQADIDLIAAAAAIPAMADMGLFEIDAGRFPIVVRRSERARVKPEDSALWQWIQRLKNGTGFWDDME